MKELLNTLKPLKLSFNEEELSEFLMLVNSITSYFKLNCIEFDRRKELRCYVIPSLRYINKHLLIKGSEDILDKIDNLVDLIEHINDLIIEKNCNVICKDIEFNSIDFDLVYFTYLWTSLTTNMMSILKYNYGWKEKKPTVSVQCGCNCGCNCNNCNCSCNCCNNNQITDNRPIQESYYSKWTSDDSYLERY